MIPLDDWLVLKLWEPQASKVEVRLALPDSVAREQDESAVFEVLAHGPDVTKVKTGDIVAMYGGLAVAKMKKPSGEYTLVGKSSDVCFIMEPKDLEKEVNNDRHK